MKAIPVMEGECMHVRLLRLVDLIVVIALVQLRVSPGPAANVQTARKHGTETWFQHNHI